MKNQSVIWGIAAAGCAMTIVCLPQASAAVSDEDFNALKKLVTEQGQKIEQLEKTNALDQQQIQQLQQQLGQTQIVATNAAQKVETLSQIQPTYPLPNPIAGATHNFMLVGDAEVQFGKTAGQHSGFALADFAPIFLFRANDNVLFEAGFDTTLQNAGGPPGTGGGANTSFSMSFGQLDYLLNDYVTVIAGDMLLPLGTYNERNAGWLNKIPDAPLLDDQILPGSGVGAQLRGAVPVGEDGQMLTYSVYGVNGPGSVTGTGTAFQTPGDPTSAPIWISAAMSASWAMARSKIFTAIPVAVAASDGSIRGSCITISSWEFRASPANGTTRAITSGRRRCWTPRCIWVPTLKSRASMPTPGMARMTPAQFIRTDGGCRRATNWLV